MLAAARSPSEPEARLSDAVDALCTRHHYPEALRSVLAAVADACRDAYPGLVSLVVTGSAATGDYVFRDEATGTRLVSDLDLMLFADAKGARPGRLREAIAAATAAHPSPLFDVDIAVSSPSALDDVPARFQMVEARQAGVVLAGDDVLDRFPTQFDPNAAIASFYNNLSKPFLWWMPRGGGFDLEYQQMVARLFLDVPLLVCARNRECIAGHRARGEAYLAEASREGLHAEAFRRRVEWALQARRAPTEERDGLERDVASFAGELIAALDAGPPPEVFDAALATRLAKPLPPRTPRRVAGELRTIVREPRSPLRDLSWWWDRKESRAAAALLGLLDHLAAIEGEASGFDPPREVLEQLAAFARTAKIERASGEAGPAFLFRCKRIYRDGWEALFPSTAKAGDRTAPLFGPGD